MKQINKAYIYIFMMICLGTSLSSCPVKDKIKTPLEGVYQLGMLQAQDSKEYRIKKGIEVVMMYTDERWLSVAYRENDKKVVYTSGGSFSLKGNILTEKIEFHSTSLDKIGDENTFVLKFYSNNKFHKSGRDKGWKVEEYWIKNE